MVNRIYFAAIFLILSACGKDDVKVEKSLFNENGEATAYYVEPEEEQVIYLWDGRPTSYIVVDDEVIFGFNGKFLGWIASGVIYNIEGKRVGFEEGALNIATLAEPAKFAKQAIPAKFAQEAIPAKPAFSEDWSTMPLDSFLLLGL